MINYILRGVFLNNLINEFHEGSFGNLIGSYGLLLAISIGGYFPTQVP